MENDGIRIISLNDGTTDNRLQLYYSGSANKIICETKVASSTQASVQYVVSSQADIHKVAFKYKENDCALWINGTEVDTDFSVSALSVVNQLEFSNYGGSVPFEGKVKQLQVFKTALTDTELATLTT